MLATLFQGSPLIDTLIGTLSAGHPMISYVLSGELLKQGVSLYAVTAFILSWVTLVLQQYWFDGYRAIQSVQDKAQVEANGCWSTSITHA